MDDPRLCSLTFAVIFVTSFLFSHGSDAFIYRPLKSPTLITNVRSGQRKSVFSLHGESTSSSNAAESNDSTESSTKQNRAWTIDGPPLETKPDYENIHGPMGKWPDKLFLTIFRTKMAEKVGVDSKLPKVSRTKLFHEH